MLVDISEVLFNELTFFRLLKSFKGYDSFYKKNTVCSHGDLISYFIYCLFYPLCLLDRHPQLSTELTSQSASENEEEEGEDRADHSQPADAASADTLRPLDPTLLEALSLVANANLAEEEEALGKVYVMLTK